MANDNYSKHLLISKSKSVNRYIFKTFPEFINYKYKRRFLCEICVLFVPTAMLIFRNLVKFLNYRGALKLLNNLYPFALIIGLMISFEFTRITEAGTCWVKRAENGKCKEIFSKDMSKEECCGRSSEFAYTEKDLSDAEYFFATALGGGANCLSCLDSCNVAKCPPGKRCVLRKGRPKCICAPLCKGSKEKKLKKNSILVLAANTNEKLTDFEFGFPLNREIRSLSELTELFPSQSQIAYNKKENKNNNDNDNDNNYNRNRKRNKNEKRRKKSQRKLSSSHDFNDNNNNYNKSSKSYNNNKVKSDDCFNINYKSAENSNNHDDKEFILDRKSDHHRHHQKQHTHHRHHEENVNDENLKVQSENELKSRKNIFKSPTVKEERNKFNLRHKKNGNIVNINYDRRSTNTSENNDENIEETDSNRQNKRQQQHHKRHQFNRRKHHQRQHQHQHQHQQQNRNYSKIQSENVTGITTTEILLLESNQKRTDLIKDNSKFSFRILNSTNVNGNNGNDNDGSKNSSSTSTTNSNGSTARQRKKPNNNGGNKRQKQQNSSLQQSTTSSRPSYSNKIMGLDEKIRNGFFNHGFPYPLSDHLIVQQNQLQHQFAPGRYFNPVCGTDGKTYKTECQLKKRACRRESTSLTVAYRGHCQTSCRNVQCLNGLNCVEDQYGIPHCIACSIICPRDDLLSPVIDPAKAVCGVDRRTYKSVCDINRMICLTGRSIGIAYNGPCQEEANCNTIHCGDRKICLTDLVTHRPRCVSCSFKCPRKRRPQGERYEDTKICGNNNHTYHSWCQMRRDSCNTEFYIDVKHVGACHKDSFPSEGLFQL